MSIDMNEEATPANTSSTVGTREACARINENNFLDADEDLPDGLVIDVTAKNVSSYDNNGTDDPVDDSGGLYAYQFRLSYTAAYMTVTLDDVYLPAINMLARNSGSSIFNFGDAVPDDNDNNWSGAAIDGSYPPLPPESGNGVLHRIRLESDSVAVGGLYPLFLEDAVIVDASGYSHYPEVVNDGEVAINTACVDIDGDSVPDVVDACPTISGPPSNNGCPLPGPPAVGGTAGLVEGGETRAFDRPDAAGSSAGLAYAALFGITALTGTALLGWRLRKRRPSA